MSWIWDDLSVPAVRPSLSEIVDAVIDASSWTRPKYFNPPPESRYLSNRNVSLRTEGPMRPVASYEQPLLPSDINLDSTTCLSKFDPPIKFVSLFIGSPLSPNKLLSSLTLSNSSSTFTRKLRRPSFKTTVMKKSYTYFWMLGVTSCKQKSCRLTFFPMFKSNWKRLKIFSRLGLNYVL